MWWRRKPTEQGRVWLECNVCCDINYVGPLKTAASKSVTPAESTRCFRCQACGPSPSVMAFISTAYLDPKEEEKIKPDLNPQPEVIRAIMCDDSPCLLHGD